MPGAEQCSPVRKRVSRRTRKYSFIGNWQGRHDRGNLARHSRAGSFTEPEALSAFGSNTSAPLADLKASTRTQRLPTTPKEVRFMEQEQGPVYQHTGLVISGGEIPPQSNSRPGSRSQQSRPPAQDRKGKDHRAEGTAKAIRKGRGIQEGSPHDGKKSSFSRRGAASQSQGDNKGLTSHDDQSHNSGSKKDPPAGGTKNEVVSGSSNPDAERGKIRRRAPKFNPGLTAPVAVASAPEETPTPRAQPSSSSKPSQTSKQRHKPRPPRSQPDDLTSTLIKALSTRPYPDCSICFSAIHPLQPTWSCSPSIPQVPNVSPADGAIPQYCWNTFHLKCIKSWAEKSVKELEKAWQNRGETGKKGEWRCPGCQAKREVVPTGYWYASLSRSNERVYLKHFQ